MDNAVGFIELRINIKDFVWRNLPEETNLKIAKKIATEIFNMIAREFDIRNAGTE